MTARRDSQRGAALIELVVLVIPAIFMLVAYILFYGRMLYHYELAQKAAHSAARYLSAAAVVNMGSTSLIGNEVAAARAMALAGLQDLQPGMDNGPFIVIKCNGSDCLGTNPTTTVTVQVQFIAHNELFGDLVPDMGNLTLRASSTLRYVGN